MKPMTLRASMILNAIVEAMGTGDHVKLKRSEAYMALSVDRLGGDLEERFSLAHNRIVNGDVCPDPDVEFMRSPDGFWYPTAMTDSFGRYTRAIVSTRAGMPEQYSPRAYESIRSFCEMWMKNLVEQQSIVVDANKHHPRVVSAARRAAIAEHAAAKAAG